MIVAIGACLAALLDAVGVLEADRTVIWIGLIVAAVSLALVLIPRLRV